MDISPELRLKPQPAVSVVNGDSMYVVNGGVAKYQSLAPLSIRNFIKASNWSASAYDYKDLLSVLAWYLAWSFLDPSVPTEIQQLALGYWLPD